jgi:hypothetical protein
MFPSGVSVCLYVCESLGSSTDNTLACTLASPFTLTGIQAMASAPRPALPREQDEWSALSKYDAQMDKRKAKEGRRKQLQQMMTVREELDAQVAYNQAMREKAILDEQGTVKKSVGTASVCKIYNPLARKLIVHHSTLPLSTANAPQCTQPPLWTVFLLCTATQTTMPPPAADLKHLSTYGAKANQLKSEVAKQARQKKEKAKVVMDTQKQVEALKIRADQEQRLSEEIHEVRLLQQNVRKYEQDRSKAKERAVVQAQREAKEYRRLAHEKNLRQEVAKQKALRERQDAEQVASTYRSEMTARETEKRRQRREYRQALDAQVDLKQAGRNSTSHLSPTERGMNRRMLANMVSVSMC